MKTRPMVYCHIGCYRGGAHTLFAIETPITESALICPYSTISNNLRTDNRWNYSSYRRCFRDAALSQRSIFPRFYP